MKKVKEIKLPMEFNPGTMRYEQILPKGKNAKLRKKIKVDWWFIISILIFVAIMIYIFIIK